MTRIYLTQIPCVKCRVEEADFIIHLSNSKREMEICDEVRVQGVCLNPECDSRFRMTITADELAVILQNSEPFTDGG